MQNRQGVLGDFTHNRRACKLLSLEGLATAKPPRPASPDETQAEIQALFEQLRQKNAQILHVQKKLNHFRSWMNSLQSKVNVQNVQAVKNAKRLYIGGFPQGSSEEELRLFLSGLMVKTGGCVQPGCSVTSIKLMKDKNYAFAEMRSVEEAANATAFDGVAYKDSYLKVKRPSNYDVNSAVLLGPVTPDPTIDISGLDICCSTVEDSPNKLFIGGLPYDNSEEQVRSILASFGALKSFNLVMDRNTGKSKGYAFCELMDGSLTDHVIQQLNGKKIGSKSLTVKRAVEGTKPASPLLSTMLSTPSPQNFSPSTTPTYGMGSANSFGFGSMPLQCPQHPLSMGNSPRGMNSSSLGRTDMGSPVVNHSARRGAKSPGVNEFIPQPVISLPSLGMGMGLDGSMPLGTNHLPSSMAFGRQNVPAKTNSYSRQLDSAPMADFGRYFGVGDSNMQDLRNLLANASLQPDMFTERMQGVNVDNCGADASWSNPIGYGAFGWVEGGLNGLQQKTGMAHSASIW